MPGKLIRHGSNAGYKAELRATGEPCDRCRMAHNVYATQYSKASKAKGIKYDSDQVIDHLYGKVGLSSGRGRNRVVPRVQTAASQDLGDYTVEAGPSGPDPSPSRPGPSLGERIKNLVMPDGVEMPPEYVNEAPTELYSIDPDPDPAGEEWEPDEDESFVINAAGMRKIEENMGTYLSIVGMTVEMIDPYCGPVLAENFDNIIQKWTKLVAHYPKAAKLFLDGKSGVVFAWIAAIQATWPVLFAIYEHHLSRSVQVDDNGTVLRKRGEHNRGRFDPMMPPTPDKFNYTVN